MGVVAPPSSLHVGMAGLIQTAPLHGYSLAFSPFHSTQLAFVGADNYGIAGRGGLVVYQRATDGAFTVLRRYGWRDGLFDVTWSELHESVIVVGSGDGCVLVFDLNIPDVPVTVLRGHTADVSCVEWSLCRQEQQLILSSSWDHTIRSWDPLTQQCVATFNAPPGDTQLMYGVCWAPALPRLFASVSGDGCLRVWDHAVPGQCSTHTSPSGCGELLTCSWNRYQQHMVCTGGVDAAIRLWDIRQLALPVSVLHGHSHAVRRLCCDPHSPSLIASSSYDCSMRVWDTSQPSSPLLETVSHHTEFTFGLDISPHSPPGLVADCSWDQTIRIYSPLSLTPRPPPHSPLSLTPRLPPPHT